MSSARPKLTGALANLMNPKPGQGVGQGAEPPAASPPPANDPAVAAAGQPPEAEKPTTIGEGASKKKPKRVQVLVRMNEEHRHLLQGIAWQKRTTVQELVEEQLLDILRRYGKI
jgi:hypothetical protein